MRRLFAGCLVAVILLGGDLIFRAMAQGVCTSSFACSVGGTLTNPTINNPTITGLLASSNIPATSGNCTGGLNWALGLNTGHVVSCGNIPSQGTDTNVLTSGTVTANTGVPFCTDANHGATTSGCSPGSVPVFQTASANTNASIGGTTMVTAGGSGNVYVFSAIAVETVVGTSCAGSTTIQLNISYTDNVTGSAGPIGGMEGASNAVPGTVSASPSIASSGNGTVNNTIYWMPTVLNAKASTTVSYSTVYTAGGSCSPAPKYYIQPSLVQIQ